MKDLFGDEIKVTPIRVNVYADEVQNHQNQITKDYWIYIGTTFELVDKPLLKLLLDTRYCKDKNNWKDYISKNNSCVHWTDIRSVNESKICERWIEGTKVNENYYFSVLGINLGNLNIREFGENDQFNVIYNRFFRTHLSHSLKKFFGSGVVVENIYHESGQQENSRYFNWHTISKLDQDESLNFSSTSIIFLPKDHKKDERSNVIQLTDLYLGAFKDLHLGVPDVVKKSSAFNTYRKPILEKLIPLFKRVVENPNNTNSSYKTFKRINVSLFPKTKSEKGDVKRMLNNFYESKDILLVYLEQNSPQMKLF